MAKKKAKKKAVSRKKTSSARRAGSRKRSTRAKTSKSRSEYLLVRIGNDAKVGNSLNVLGVEASLDKAKAAVRDISNPNVQRVAILEKKIVLTRRPAVKVEEDKNPNIISS